MKSLTERTITPETAGPRLHATGIPSPVHLSVEFSHRGAPFKVAHSVMEPQDGSWFSYHDEEDVRERDWDVRPGDLVLDVGAAYGSYTMCALAAGAGHVWAWSPQKYTRNGVPEADYMLFSAEVNGWQDRVTVVPGGVYSRNGWLDCLTQEFHRDRPEAPRDPADLLQVQTVDQWRASMAAPFSRLEWMKLDVEGAEASVLVGARDTISEFRPRIQVELHRFKDNNTVQDVDAVMRSLGYSCLHVIPYHGVSHGVYLPVP